MENDALDVLVRVIRDERGALIRLARSEGVTAEDAIDCVHDAFCTFLRMILTDALPVPAPAPGAYLAGIVRNAARNRRRLHHVNKPHADVEELALIAPQESPVEDLERAERHIRLHACVERLCDTQRAVVSLRLLEERRGEDVAEALGISRAYVDVLLHRAKRALTSCMTEP
ncbi:sigma-70 family RNA polymerase sigma factor [bacterium]|nr:MAG: sigma-70 family RNA polymerase sigma factor [bacterium]